MAGFRKLSFGKKVLLWALVTWGFIVIFLTVVLQVEICWSIFLLVMVLIYAFAFWWGVTDIDYDARKAAIKMKEINTNSPLKLKEIPKKSWYYLAVTKGANTVGILYFLAYFGSVLTVLTILYFLNPHPKEYPYAFLSIWILFALIQAYFRKKIFERALELLKKGELDEEYYKPHPTFPLRKCER